MERQVNGETKDRGISGEMMVVIWTIIGCAAVALSVVAALFIALNSNINRVNDALLATNAAIAELAKESAAQNAAQNEAIRALSDDVAANGAAIAANGKAIADLNNRVGNLEIRVGKIEVRLESIERRLPDVEEMDDRLDALEQGQAELKELVDALILVNAE